MQIETKHCEDGAVVRIRGEVTMQHARSLRHALGEAIDRGTGAVVVALDEVPYVDSSAIATLFEAFQRATRVGRRFLLAGLRSQVLELLRLCRLLDVFSVHDSLENALASLGTGGRCP